MSEVKQYAERDLMAMDIAGNHYCRHVSAMTREQLHSKSDIAAELGWRDMQIATLKAECDALAAEVVNIREQAEHVYAAGYNHGHLNTVDGIAYAPGIKDEFYHNALQVMLEMETPATDAYLNSVRAEGVDMFISELAELFKTLKTGGKTWQAVKGIAMRAASFAAQLRAGEPS